LQETVENCQLVDEHGAEHKTLGSDQSFGRHGVVNIENSLKMFVEVFNRNRTGFVQNLTNLDAIIVMWIGVVFAGKGSAQGYSPGYYIGAVRSRHDNVDRLTGNAKLEAKFRSELALVRYQQHWLGLLQPLKATRRCRRR